MIEAEWWEYDSLEELADAVAGDVGFIIDSAVEARNASLIAVPGGKTGPAIFPKLAAQKLPWKRLTIIPDRRPAGGDGQRPFQCARDRPRVSSDRRARHPDRRPRSRLQAGRQLGRRAFAGPAVAAGPGVARHGRRRPYRVDLPGPDLQAALDAPKARRAIGVMPDPMPAEAPVARVTLTRAAILSARTLLITITGAEEREVLEQAIADGQSSKLPIGRVLAEAEQPIDIHWCAVGEWG